MALPETRSVPGREAQPPRRHLGRTRQDARDIGAQHSLRRVIVHEAARLDAADAAALGLAHVPYPARIVRGRHGLRPVRADRRPRHLRRGLAVDRSNLPAYESPATTTTPLPP